MPRYNVAVADWPEAVGIDADDNPTLTTERSEHYWIFRRDGKIVAQFRASAVVCWICVPDDETPPASLI